ncbi:VOC family protein [Lysinibacillus odysseyi]|uniref:Glyoxalase n=1 Tax=Lysinibacillus odysseyi 34hs-1 = NBRC 100172 TaxID=1220589 RepID=A0A0A3IBP5_9BACI|nr:VOC family protein [Lysinibacillus odysseyi]KGR82201.1 glyoxalase [Lysinibacillus odysseyi 34hs-1 = NBRC 100172]
MFTIGSIFIPVTDIQKSTVWYESNLGVKKIDSWEEGAGFYFPSGSAQLALVQVDTPQPTEFVIKGKRRNVYYNFVVQDIEAVHRQLNANGVVTTEIEEFGDMKGFDFYDPDGNPFSVVNEEEGSPFHSDHIKKQQEHDKTSACE